MLKEWRKRREEKKDRQTELYSRYSKYIEDSWENITLAQLDEFHDAGGIFPGGEKQYQKERQKRLLRELKI